MFVVLEKEGEKTLDKAFCGWYTILDYTEKCLFFVKTAETEKSRRYSLLKASDER